MAMVVVDASCLKQADSQPKSRGLVWGSAAAWRCSTFTRWTKWTLAMTSSMTTRFTDDSTINIVVVLVIIIVIIPFKAPAQHSLFQVSEQCHRHGHTSNMNMPLFDQPMNSTVRSVSYWRNASEKWSAIHKQLWMQIMHACKLYVLHFWTIHQFSKQAAAQSTKQAAFMLKHYTGQRKQDDKMHQT